MTYSISRSAQGICVLGALCGILFLFRNRPLHLSRDLYKSTLFLTNKPNFRAVKMNLSDYLKRSYKEKRAAPQSKNKPNQTQFSPAPNKLGYLMLSFLFEDIPFLTNVLSHFTVRKFAYDLFTGLQCPGPLFFRDCQRELHSEVMQFCSEDISGRLL